MGVSSSSLNRTETKLPAQSPHQHTTHPAEEESGPEDKLLRETKSDPEPVIADAQSRSSSVVNQPNSVITFTNSDENQIDISPSSPKSSPEQVSSTPDQKNSLTAASKIVRRRRLNNQCGNAASFEKLPPTEEASDNIRGEDPTPANIRGEDAPPEPKPDKPRFTLNYWKTQAWRPRNSPELTLQLHSPICCLGVCCCCRGTSLSSNNDKCLFSKIQAQYLSIT